MIVGADNAAAGDIVVDQALGSIHPLDTVESGSCFLLACFAGGTMKLGLRAATILQLRWDGRSFGEIAAHLQQSDGALFLEDDVARYYARLVEAIRTSSAAHVETTARRGFQLRINLLSHDVVGRIARLFQIFYEPTGVAVLLACAVLGYAAALTSGVDVKPSDAREGLIAYGLVLVSMFVHEFGHASASQRFGIPPGPIGFTLYLVFPALYTNISPCWKLPRAQRVIVDLAGSFFQLALGALYYALFLGTSKHAFYIATIVILISTVFNLNPVLKLDGYWVVADALGVTNLGDQPGRLLTWCWQRVALKQQPAALPWPRTTLVLLAGYTLASAAVWGYFVVMLGNRFSMQLGQMIDVFSHGTNVAAWTSPSGMGRIAALLISAVFLSFMLRRFVRLGKRGFAAAGRKRVVGS